MLTKTGKVRTLTRQNDHTIIMTTSDRLSAFDRYICDIPTKGAVLTQLSAWWFKKTQHITPNHFIALTPPNSMQIKACTPIPIEVVVRGYLTGSTATSIWTRYQKGERQFFNTHLPDGLQKGDMLPHAILTPTTKSDTHDEPLSSHNLPVSDAVWQTIAEKALALFKFGQKHCRDKGFILMDTKYEFGFDEHGDIILIDECHTPDSSRICSASDGQHYDKEYLRSWLKEQIDPYEDDLPFIPESRVTTIQKRYQTLFHQLTGEPLCVVS